MAEQFSKSPKFYSRLRNLEGIRHSYKSPIGITAGVPLGLGIILMMMAIAYEVLFAVVTHRGGLSLANRSLGIGHWAWTLPPVAIATALSVAITSLHFISQRLEPLSDLAAGQSLPKRSLHLDYLSMALPFTFWNALNNRHLMVAGTACMTALALGLSSLSATIFVVNTVQKPVQISLLQSTGFGLDGDLSSFTDFVASAAITYAIIAGNGGSFPTYTTPNFALPVYNRTNNPSGEPLVPVTFQSQAIHSMANCEFATITSTQRPNNTATRFVAGGGGLPSGCTYNFTATPQLTYNTDIVKCPQFPNATYAPVVIWLGIDFPAGSAIPSVHPVNSTVAPANVSVVVCSPTLGVVTVDVTVNVDDTIDQNNIQALSSDLPFPLTDGLAFNGLSYPLDQLDVRAQQRLQNMQFQLTDAIYSTVIQKDVVNSDVRNKLLSSMSTNYQLFLSILASRVLFVSIDNGNTTIGISHIPLPYLFVSGPSVHILTGLFSALAVFSLLVAYQLHHKNNNNDFTEKLAAITGNPFTLAGAMGMSSRSLWEEGVTIPSKESVGALSDSPQDRIVQDQIAFATETTKQDMMQHLGEYTYTLDLSGKVVRDP